MKSPFDVAAGWHQYPSGLERVRAPRRQHRLPIGAELLPDGVTCFRLWAPGVNDIRLVIDPGAAQREIVMESQPGGWCCARLTTPIGTRYAYLVDGGDVLPDPGSRWNPEGVNGASVVLDPLGYEWHDCAWRGRPWSDAVLYELHIGAFTTEGTFDAARAHLPRLAELGITCLEMMPIAQVQGQRNWGYDGALLFAPYAQYGAPEDLKSFVDASHAVGVMVLLDVVYNHLGPGNPLERYAPCFLSSQHKTPWGRAMNFDGPSSETVREFFIQNALYWLDEYGFDGLRLDAVQGMVDDSPTHVVDELVERVYQRFGGERHVHIVLENERNEARYLRHALRFSACGTVSQWNDDVHHAAHVVLTGETDGYYVDYKHRPVWYLGRALAEGFAYQGEPSEHRGGQSHGEASAGLPLEAFVNFVQTHDQIANRPSGVRLVHEADNTLFRAMMGCLLLAPSPPLFFMGDEFASSSPFFYFCDFPGQAGSQVAAGRLKEFERFDRYKDPAVQATIPDPNALTTFERSKLNWSESAEPMHRDWSDYYRQLLRVRRQKIQPFIRKRVSSGRFGVEGRLLRVSWQSIDGSRLILTANFDDHQVHQIAPVDGEIIFRSADPHGLTDPDHLSPHSIIVWMTAAKESGPM